MKRLVTAFVLLVLFAMSGSTQSRNKRRASAPPLPSIITIHQIDFRNYTFPLDGKSYKLIDGFYAENVAPGVQWGLGLVDGPYYGDLTGDKKEEEAFVLRYGQVNGPGTAEARVYTLRNGQAVLLATLPVAEGASCQLDHYIKIEDGMLTVERVYGSGQRCDYTEVTQYRWDGRGLTPVGAPTRNQCRCT
ncbi:MAG: hypothetical protein DMF66_12035 [Acidobacteria bacterium]|nr:MAG: hypothetical protein DMF66_12035 [Acidobacteriota bacterium]